MYAAVRKASPPDRPAAWEAFRAARDDLFKSHPQSPLTPTQRSQFSGLDYYPYRYTRVARVRFSVADHQGELSLFWIEGYGGGLFLPFRDATSSHQTYGGGRYLYDTIKGADLGSGPREFVLDFNYAYNPSCAYNSHWECPLSPRENWLPLAIEAGEKEFSGQVIQETDVPTSISRSITGKS
jgi:uncharacterized protein (DUF1684 family)